MVRLLIQVLVLFLSRCCSVCLVFCVVMIWVCGVCCCIQLCMCFGLDSSMCLFCRLVRFSSDLLLFLIIIMFGMLMKGWLNIQFGFRQCELMGMFIIVCSLSWWVFLCILYQLWLFLIFRLVLVCIRCCRYLLVRLLGWLFLLVNDRGVVFGVKLIISGFFSICFLVWFSVSCVDVDQCGGDNQCCVRVLCWVWLVVVSVRFRVLVSGCLLLGMLKCSCLGGRLFGCSSVMFCRCWLVISLVVIKVLLMQMLVLLFMIICNVFNVLFVISWWVCGNWVCICGLVRKFCLIMIFRLFRFGMLEVCRLLGWFISVRGVLLQVVVQIMQWVWLVLRLIFIIMLILL